VRLSSPLALFLVAAVALGLLVAAGSGLHAAVHRADETLALAATELGEAERLRSLRERTSRKTRSFLFSRRPRFVAELREAERELDELTDAMRQRAVSAEQLRLLDRIEYLETTRRGIADRVIAAAVAGASHDQLLSATEDELQPVSDAYDEVMTHFVHARQQVLAQARAASVESAASGRRIVWGAGIVALAIAAVSSLALGRTLRRFHGRAEQARRERDRFFEMSIDMACIAGSDGWFKQLNPAFEVTLGYTRQELLSRPFIELVHPEDRAATLREVERLAQGQSMIDFTNRYRCKDGSFKWLSWHAMPDQSGAIHALARDVTEYRRAQAKLLETSEALRRQAVVDELTGLHNRRGFGVLAEHQLRRADRSGAGVLACFVDVDGLKAINDTLGHDAGDRAIRAAARILQTSFRASDVIARLGGDEFVVLAVDANVESHAALAERLDERIAEYNAAPDREFALAMSTGWAVYDPASPEPLDALLKRADAMMYRAKIRRRSAA
jgi:diguanylate cyclase (GGDEF)-like protein/PAS domain S-box-containing protein